MTTVRIDFARQLERELTVAHTRIKLLEEAHNALKELYDVQSCGCFDGGVHCPKCTSAIKRYHAANFALK
jgi:hypothetical protein